MIEREIGYCGSKFCHIIRWPLANQRAVKEQRVDGSYIGQSILRCTLMGFERSCFIVPRLGQSNLSLGKLTCYPRDCQVKILSNHKNSNIKYFSTLITPKEQPFKLNPWFITGLADGESNFILGVVKNNKYKTGWNIKTRFQIPLHNKDGDLLLQIRNYFGVGKIGKHDVESSSYRVESIKELEIIINHFDTYHLITQKWSDYQLFKQVVELYKNKEHLTTEGLNKLIAIKASLNLGLSDKLKTAFPKVIPVNKPIVPNQNIPDPMWIAGFTSAEGCFLVSVKESKTISLGYQTILRFQITQHCRDKLLLTSIYNYLGCGRLRESKNV